MKKSKNRILNLFLGLGCLALFSFTEATVELEPSTRSKFLGWSNMACVPSGEGLIELNCKQCYYVLWVAFDCRSCVNYVGSSTNVDCKDL